VDVGIVGAGTAGAASALFLSRAGHRVTVYERVPDPGAVGAGIVLQPTGQAVLARLGLFEAVHAKAARLDGLKCVTDRGRTVVDLAYETVSRDLFGLGTHRGLLFHVLFSAAKREANVRCGTAIVSLERRLGKVIAIDEHGERHGPHDLLIVADGARSQLREHVRIPGMHVRRYPWGALWFLAHDPERWFRGRLLQIVRSNARMLGFLPTGEDANDRTPVTSIYWSMHGDAVAAFRRAPIGEWKNEVRAMLDGAGDKETRVAAESLLAQIRDESQLVYTAYHDVRAYPYGDDSVVLLGDAAHAMSPQLGQGCNLALMDALVLAESVHAFPEHPARAIATYALRRRTHLSLYGQATRWLTPFFQGDAGVLGDLRDLFMAPAGRIPFVRRLMTLSMSGTLGSWLGHTMALPPRESQVPGLLPAPTSP
jgi:2-polyprenyl-6-methoxyphenol hydroxylase-like FAD-dependent oxidoreductase